ncbi:hypothetical protein [Candidatus Methylacidithermus pantelleriae]|uniref:Uncharacterized protein n=1 Tax=Candidatus Methylacidithermus pantelleriae TaxID=2744239 RepID=A0A8J2BKQ3_9BACT|nr:hypothetical protein [Candidatus Methylacidithermus pantelleriae]CAF0697067.1 hypothetical protein MPNT_200046 [Candidatus Methylacidithermus pantelleriae]
MPTAGGKAAAYRTQENAAAGTWGLRQRDRIFGRSQLIRFFLSPLLSSVILVHRFPQGMRLQ